jgi:hypothetical protein
MPKSISSRDSRTGMPPYVFVGDKLAGRFEHLAHRVILLNSLCDFKG